VSNQGAINNSYGFTLTCQKVMAKDRTNTFIKSRQNILRLFEWEYSSSYTLTVLTRIILGAASLLLTSSVVQSFNDSQAMATESICCWEYSSDSMTLGEWFLMVAFLDASAAVVGAFIYSARCVETDVPLQIEVTQEKDMREDSSSETKSSPLSRVKVAAPCPAEWRFMYGDDRVRFCGQCSLNVYNLSAMTGQEAEDLIRRTEGRLCVRFYRRKDGTIVTQNCPVGLRAIRDKLTRSRNHIVAAVLSFFAYVGILSLYRGATSGRNVVQRDVRGAIESSGIPAQGQVFVDMSHTAPRPRLVERSESYIRDRAIFKVTPVSSFAGADRVKGEVVVKVTVSQSGEVDTATCVKGHPLLRELAEEAARRWRFEPVLDKGTPVRVESTLTFNIGRTVKEE
jgi:TonB family protein